MLNIIFLSLLCLLYDIKSLIEEKICARLTPLMNYKEIIIVKEVLKNRKPKRCLEWGAGYSTLYFPKYIGKSSKWISIEHDKQWFNKIRQLTANNDQVSIYYVPPNQWPPTDAHSDGSFSDFQDYIKFPQKFSEKFDFILIDGRARKFCLIKAFNLLRDDGIVILHDANRKYYHKPFKLYDNQILFCDSRTSAGGIWIGSKKISLNRILDIEKHRLNWRLLENILELTRINWWRRRKQ
jgi:SAM-dependent methyltransferase